MLKSLLFYKQRDMTDTIAHDPNDLVAENDPNDSYESLDQTPVSISEINVKSLSDKEFSILSTNLKVKHQDNTPDLKVKWFAGVAPSRFNLSKTSQGRYVTKIVVLHHKWKSVRSKYLWQILRLQVLGDKARPDDDEEEEEEEATNYNHSMSQGFKLAWILKRNTEIVAVTNNSKLASN